MGGSLAAPRPTLAAFSTSGRHAHSGSTQRGAPGVVFAASGLWRAALSVLGWPGWLEALGGPNLAVADSGVLAGLVRVCLGEPLVLLAWRGQFPNLGGTWADLAGLGAVRTQTAGSGAAGAVTAVLAEPGGLSPVLAGPRAGLG